MARFACLLRGINVTGKRKIKMTELVNLCSSLGFLNIKTYLQSGNIVLCTDTPQAKLGPLLSEAIDQSFGYPDVDVIVRSVAQFAAIVDGNPFVDRGADPKSLYVTFISKKAGPGALATIDATAYRPDEFAPGPSPLAVYVHCPNGYGRTKLSNQFFERKLGLSATTRNWQTTNRLYALLND